MNNNIPVIVNRYLKKYSFSSWTLESNLNGSVENIIVVPVICEYDNLRRLLYSLLKNDPKYLSNTIIIFVINGFLNSSENVKQDNRKTLSFCRKIVSSSASSDPLVQEIKISKLNIGFIDACSPGLEMPLKIGGVGLARKIGMDAALRIFDYNSSAKKILICLDADCTVEPNYLNVIVNEFNQKNLSAATVKFKHCIEEDSSTAPAIICYEIFLRYYVLGLKYAGSPFAFHTLGSTMICDYESYIKVEGMNKRKAAEDFYFIEKLAKNVMVGQISSTTVYPSSRSSWRVPFGTGQRVGRFLSQKQNEYLLYDPRCFDILKQWLNIFSTSVSLNPAEYIRFARNIHPELSNFLLQQNFINDWEKIFNNSTTTEQIAKQKQKWFDGFRTLKLIHHLRDADFPQVNMFKALNNMFERIGIKMEFWEDEINIPSLDIQKKYLEILRELA